MSLDHEQTNDEINANQTLLKPTSWLAQLDFINHLLLFNNIMLVAFAEKKGGKTTYIQFLQQHLNDSFDIFVSKSATPFDESSLAKGVANHLNLAKHDKVTISDISHQVNERNHHTLVILDDAHNLSEQQIEQLLNIIKSQNQTPYFHMILVSDYSLLPYLNQLSENDADDTIHSIEVGAFNRDEIKTYLHHKLSDDHLRAMINQKSCDGFYSSTKGQIAAMNHEMQAYFSVLAKSTKKLSKRLSFATAAAVLVIGGVFSIQLWQEPENLSKKWLTRWFDGQHKQDKLALTSNARSVGKFVQPGYTLTSHIEKVNLPTTELAFNSQLHKIDYRSLNVKSKLVSHSDEMTTERTKQDSAVLTNSQPSTKENSRSLRKVGIEKNQHLNQQQVKMSQTINPKIDYKIKAKHNKDDKTTLVVKTGVTQPKVVKQQITKPVDSKIASIQISNQTRKVASIPPKYTIQLVATHKQKFLKALLAKYPVSYLKVHTYPIYQNGEQWYVLTAGSFANWSEAHDALAKLPPEYTQFKPWIRPIDKA